MANIGRVMELFDLWKDIFPKILPYYAVKCNSDPLLLKVLASLGTGFDCASKVNRSQRTVKWEPQRRLCMCHLSHAYKIVQSDSAAFQLRN